MTGRERLQKTLNHEVPDKVPVDIGATIVSGISAKTLIELKEHLELTGETIKIQDPFFMIGQMQESLREVLQVDVVGVFTPYTKLGFENRDWKEWEFEKGRVGMVGGGFNITVDENGYIYAYPQGDTSVPPSAMMPKDGYYFDAIVRQGDISPKNLNGKKDFEEQFGIYSEQVLRDIERDADHFFKHTDYGIIGNFTGTSLGDFSSLPGPGLKETPGIRSIEDWLMAHVINQSYIKEVFDYQTEVAIENLKHYKQAVGDKIQAVYVSGTDFGTQHCELISPKVFRELYKPYFTTLNKWIHDNTSWKTFYHSCGSIPNLLDDFVEMGVDILNPVQCSANGMDPVFLKEKYGDKLVFWGGGIDTQHVLPFGTPEQVRLQTLERLEIFAKGGGYVFNAIHNIQANTPIANMMAMINAVKDFNTK